MGVLAVLAIKSQFAGVRDFLPPGFLNAMAEMFPALRGGGPPGVEPALNLPR